MGMAAQTAPLTKTDHVYAPASGHSAKNPGCTNFHAARPHLSGLLLARTVGVYARTMPA